MVREGKKGRGEEEKTTGELRMQMVVWAPD